MKIKNLLRAGLLGIVLSGLAITAGCKRGERVNYIWQTEAGKIQQVQEDIVGTDKIRLEFYTKQGKKVADFTSSVMSEYDRARICLDDGQDFVIDSPKSYYSKHIDLKARTDEATRKWQTEAGELDLYKNNDLDILKFSDNGKQVAEFTWGVRNYPSRVNIKLSNGENYTSRNFYVDEDYLPKK